MSLPVPVVEQEPGPDWANDINACMGILDQHSHVAGQGALITPAALNINSDLNFQGNNLTNLKALIFSSQVSPIAATSPYLGALYVAESELYYNDEVGNQVQITLNGNVNSGAGSISGLPSGTASASYSSGSQTFVWQSATNTPANMDFASAIFRNLVANSFGLTLNAPNAMGADYDVTLPQPNNSGSSVFLIYDTSNNIGNGPAVNGGLTDSNISPKSLTNASIANGTLTQILKAPMAISSTASSGQFALSAASGLFASNSTTPIQVTNLSVTITTTGRPVQIGLQSEQPGGGTCFVANENTNLAFIYFFNGVITNPSNEIYTLQITGLPSGPLTVPPPSGIIDTTVNGLPGTYTYNVAVANTGGFTDVFDCQLYAFEI